MAGETTASEPTFQDLVDAIADVAIFRLDADGAVASWSAAAERIYGYGFAEVQGQSFARFLTLEDRHAGVPEAMLAQARAGSGETVEGWRLRKSGSRFRAAVSTHALRDADGVVTGFVTVTRDLTEQRAAEQALAESERRFRHLVEGVTDYAIYMLDVDGVVTNWNRGAERAKGYSAREVVGRHFRLFYPPEDQAAQAPERALAEALRRGRWEAEGWRVRKDGSRFWAQAMLQPIHDETGRHIGFAKITRDISERKAAEEALAQSERQFRMLVAGVVDYALIMLDPSGVVSSWNVGAQQIKGYAAEEIIGRHVEVFYTEAERAAGAAERALEIARTSGRHETEGWRVRKDGGLFWANVVLDAIRDENGDLVGFAKITRDVTERRNAQVELQKAHDRLAQAQKMEAIGQLTGGVAHDFNNLLMVVGGQAELLRRRLGEDPRAARALEAIEVSTRRGQELTRQLLAFARRQRLNPQALSLHERTAAFKDLLEASLGAVELQTDLPADLWTIVADPGELELAILNLAVNARDAMTAGGVLRIAARNADLAHGDAELGLQGEFVALTIEDTGAGIPPDILPRIFEPFFSTKEVSRGTGLGLSQVYGFAEQSGGRVAVSSELGVGSRFTLYLPRATEDAPAAAPPASMDAPHGVNVLVVEDNPEVAEVAAALLEQLGNRPRVVTSATAALSELDAGDRPDLLFSDIVMAGEMDGLALARRVRARWPDLPILLTSGYSQSAEKIGDEFAILPKPYQLPELSRALGSVLSRAPAE